MRLAIRIICLASLMPPFKRAEPQGLQSKLEKSITLLREIERDYSPAVMATSFGAEGTVIIHLLAEYAPGIGIFTIDTGRLPQETHDVAARVRDKYGLPIRYYYPDPATLEAFVTRHGPNAFYQQVELRRNCCAIRKVDPLERALVGKRAWLAGLRRQHSSTRAQLAEREWDEERQLHKFYPLLEWSDDELWTFIQDHDVPYNQLYDQGYRSIGCASCTRPVTMGEDPRAGRWWWENDTVKECGLHLQRPKQPDNDWSI